MTNGLGDGETLYLAPGAWVEGCLDATGRNMTICGSGVLSGACWNWREGPKDDCVTPKWWCENLVCTNMTLWTDAANAFRAGYECEPGPSGLVYRNLLFKDTDVLHLALNRRPYEHYWANSAICIQPAHGQLMEDTLYEDIRFHEVGPEDIFLNVKTMAITSGSKRCSTDEAGTLKGLVLRNIHLPDSQGGMNVNFSAKDEDHPILGVRFEDVTGYGPVTKSGKVELHE